MSVPVEPGVRSPSIIPLWIMAAAISTVAIRYTFFPPCCATISAQPVYRVLCDSVRPIPDGSSECGFGVGDTAYMISPNVMVLRGPHRDTIPIPEGGSIEFRRK